MADLRFTTRTNVDKYGKNPLEQDLLQANPLIHAIASRERPAPTVWHSGDLPAFTASGLNPAILSTLPIGVRHAAAAMTSTAEVFALAEQVAGNPDAVIRSQGLDEYEARVRNWGAGIDERGNVQPVTDPESADQLYTAMFGEDGAALKPPPSVDDRLEAVMERGVMVWRERETEAEPAS